jgi:hypothetical protein
MSILVALVYDLDRGVQIFKPLSPIDGKKQAARRRLFYCSSQPN